jgi:long-chain fatty acid transport protein
VTFNLGLAVRPTDALSLALTYQHGADVDFEGDFELDMDDDFFTGDLEHVGLKFKPTVTGDAHVRIRLPKRIGAAAGYDLSERLHLEVRGQYVTWSDLKAMYVELHSPDLAQPALGLPPTSKLALVRNFDDTVSLAVAGRFQLKPGVHLLGLLGYDSPASPDSTIDASSPDGHRLTFGAGAGFALTQDTSLIGDARFITLVPRTVTGSENDLGNGDYALSLAAVTAHLQVKF